MAILELEVKGYRSLRDVRLPLEQLTVITGPNGSGKSNLYRALWLISRICEGDFGRAICREGGLLSAMWASPRTNAKKPVRMTLGFRASEFSFHLECGFPVPSATRFLYDPQIKEEAIWVGKQRKPSITLLERSVGYTWMRDIDGNRVEYPLMLGENESVLSQLREPHRFPDLFAMREEVHGWRFYHTFRTDEAAPVRAPQVSVRTPVLSHDGSDLAAALATISEIGDGERLERTIETAFPGRSLVIQSNDDFAQGKSPRFTELSVGLETEGCTRPLMARELSDGTMKFLCLAAALLSPRPTTMIALNEPEASLHPDLLAPLAELIVHASRVSQVWVTTHSTVLCEAIQKLSGVRPLGLALESGETVIQER